MRTFLVCLALSIFTAGAQEPPPVPSYTYRAEVVRVLDGDTVELDIDLGFSTWVHKRSIRLLDVLAPESRTTNLAEKLELPPAEVSHWETGQRLPGAANLRKLSVALNVSADYLLDSQ